MTTAIISVLLLVLLALAVRHIVKVTRRGGCVGCSENGHCEHGCKAMAENSGNDKHKSSIA